MNCPYAAAEGLPISDSGTILKYSLSEAAAQSKGYLIPTRNYFQTLEISHLSFVISHSPSPPLRRRAWKA